MPPSGASVVTWPSVQPATNATIAMAMAKDRTLPAHFAYEDPKRGTPIVAIGVTLATIVALLIVASGLFIFFRENKVTKVEPDVVTGP